MKRSQAEDFIIAPRLPFWARLVVSILMVSGAFFMQVEGAGPVKVVGTAVMVVFVLFNWVRRIKITRDKHSGATEWQATTTERFNAALSKVGRINSVVHTPASGVLFWIVLAFLAPVLVMMADDLPGTSATPIIFTAIDGLLILFVVFSSGNRSIWTPRGLKMKLEELLAVARHLGNEPELEVEPQFLLEKKGDEGIPLDAKLMIRGKKEMPPGLLGMQVSLALNSVQGKDYPYLYTVLVARSAYGLKNKLAAVGNGDFPANLLLELKNQKGDIQVAVIRQNTKISRGYWTRKKAVTELLAVSLEFLKGLLRTS